MRYAALQLNYSCLLQSPEVSAMWSKVKQDCKGNDRALNWGSSMEMKAMPEWAKSSFIENVMYVNDGRSPLFVLLD